MKAKTNNNSKKATNVAVDPKANYRAALAKALGKPVAEVTPVEVPEDKPERTIVKSETFGRRNPFNNTVKSETKEQQTVAAVISKEIKKSKIVPLNEEDIVTETVDDEPDAIAEEIQAHGGKKVIPQNTLQAQKLINKGVRVSPKELEAQAERARLIAEGKAHIEAQKQAKKGKGKPVAAAPVKKSLKDMNDKERAAYYKELSAKALAAKQAKAEANGTVKPEPKADEKTLLKRRFNVSDKTAESIVNNPLAGKIVPKGTEVKAPKKSTPKVSAKSTTDNKVTRIECVGRIIQANPDADSDTIISQADDLYAELSGSVSNIKETTFCYRYAVNFLKGYNA